MKHKTKVKQYKKQAIQFSTYAEIDLENTSGRDLFSHCYEFKELLSMNYETHYLSAVHKLYLVITATIKRES